MRWLRRNWQILARDDRLLQLKQFPIQCGHDAQGWPKPGVIYADPPWQFEPLDRVRLREPCGARDLLLSERRDKARLQASNHYWRDKMIDELEF